MKIYKSYLIDLMVINPPKPNIAFEKCSVTSEH